MKTSGHKPQTKPVKGRLLLRALQSNLHRWLFRFLPAQTIRLIPLGVAGLVTAMTVYISGNEEHVITLIFAPMVVFWAIGEGGERIQGTTDGMMEGGERIVGVCLPLLQ